MGGGFGSKSTLGNYGRLAVALSRQAGAPVRLTLTRPEEQVDSGNRPATRSAHPHRRAARRDADRGFGRKPRHRRRRAQRRHRQFRPVALRLPELRIRAIRRLHQRGAGQRHARPRQYAGRLGHGDGDRRARRASGARSASSCASASIRARCGARSGGSARRRSAGRAATRRAPTPARSSAAWAWRSRFGARMCRPRPPSKCGSIATDRSRRCRAFRTSARASAS